jgi:DNA-binding FadR family transcriptional regulator
MARMRIPTIGRAPNVPRSLVNPTSRGGSDALERNTYNQIAYKLGQEIVAGVYPAGSLLPNAADMRARFSVSRTVLREAYSILSAKSLILARPKIGTRVRPRAEWSLFDPEVLAWHLQAAPTEHFVGELFALREMVEPAAGAIAAASPSDITVEQIADAYRSMERFKNGTGDLIVADLEFHTAILRSTNNRFLAAIVGLIHAALKCTFEFSWQGATHIRDDRLLQHKAIFEAIRDRNPERARDRMAELLRDSNEDVRGYLNARGGIPAR